MACKPCPDDIHIAQGADITLAFQDNSAGADFSDITEATFQVWQNGITGSSLISKSLTGSDITVVSSTRLQVSLTDTETAALTPMSHYYEVWVTSDVGLKYNVGFGKFVVRDTRQYD